MRVTSVREMALPLSRYGDVPASSGGLTTSVVAVVTDAMRGGRPVVGYGYGSVGRYAQGGLIRERFAPRLLAMPDLRAEDGGLDPFRAWDAMMAGEKAGGHGERCVAVGTLDMALWDAAAKIAQEPLHRLLSRRLGRDGTATVAVYAGGGYPYPHDDLCRLRDEIRRFRDAGFLRAKIKLGGVGGMAGDLRRVEVASGEMGGAGLLAVDAMNAFGPETAVAAAQALAPLGLWWFEDICDPLDFDTHRRAVIAYGGAVAAGEALFHVTEARLLAEHGGLRSDRDVLVFDPVHCYGLPGYLRIVADLTARGWPRRAFWPHGGHRFAVHVASALGLGGVEVTPEAFAPFRGLGGCDMVDGAVVVPETDGIGFEADETIRLLLSDLSA